tara:strand:+ start:385 stop:660 length:276 start_codon:yes stop_codon:yes gene_type:complete
MPKTAKKQKKDPLIEELFKNKEKNTYPSVVISGSGDAWFLNPETKTMQRIFRGSVVQKITTTPDERGRHLVKLGAIYIMIPDDELFSIGDN